MVQPMEADPNFSTSLVVARVSNLIIMVIVTIVVMMIQMLDMSAMRDRIVTGYKLIEMGTIDPVCETVKVMIVLKAERDPMVTEMAEAKAPPEDPMTTRPTTNVTVDRTTTMLLTLTEKSFATKCIRMIEVADLLIITATQLTILFTIDTTKEMVALSTTVLAEIKRDPEIR
jgi:hypothetical protein